MEKYKASRGWRNNNPLNIRRGENWQGMRAKQTDAKFCQFLNMTWGYRAAVRVLLSYYHHFTQSGIDWDVVTIINRWAPTGENNTSAYIDNVLRFMGRERCEWNLAAPNTSPGRLQLAMLVAAMTCVETGCPPSAVPVENINAGFVLAHRGDPKLPKTWWQ